MEPVAIAATDWPCYRHDGLRSGSSPATVPTELKVRWTRKLASRPQGPIATDWSEDPNKRYKVVPSAAE